MHGRKCLVLWLTWLMSFVFQTFNQAVFALPDRHLSSTSNTITIFPCDSQSLDINWFRYKPGMQELSCWQQVDRVLQSQNLHFETSDKFTPVTFRNSSKIICCNIPNWTKDFWENLPFLPQSKAILIAYEPPTVLPQMYSKSTLQYFHKVLTWDDSLVDNKKFFKFNYTVLTPMRQDVPSFAVKKLLTQISRNKQSSHSDELYSERLKVILYFENKREGDFEFYGQGWGQENYRNYRGAPPDKSSVLKNYKFCICYENMKNVKGYITEKIFDCFAAGCVPIYLGASNVTDYIPRNCFIARQDFASFDALLHFLKTMNEETYNLYLRNIRSYLRSSQARQFSQEAFAEEVLRALEIEK